MNHKIDTSSWRVFEFTKVFKYKRGKRYKKDDHVSGDIAYISSSKFNNGISSYVTPPSYMKIYKNAMTINNSGSVGYCFFHNYEFVCSDHCTVLEILDKSINLNRYIALFLKPIIEKIKTKYDFAREISDERLEQENIMLPCNSNNEPDWVFMESYIKEMVIGIIYDNDNISHNIKNLAPLNITTWKEFKYNEIFNEPIKGERLTETDRIQGETPLVTASSVNNGITSFIDKNVFFKNKKLLSNSITIDMFFNVFYHAYEYFSDDNIHTVVPKKEINIFASLFLVTILKQSLYKYDFGRQLRIERLKKESFNLPVDSQGNPDWDYMENYIKSLPYSSSL